MRPYWVLASFFGAAFFGSTFFGMAFTITDSYSDCEGIVSWISDGDCDPSNNNEDCGYDGGDCCECDCEDAEYECGDFDCIDPSSACYDSGLGTPAIVGIAVGGVVVVGAVVAIVVLCMTGRLKACACCSSPSAQPQPSTMSQPPHPTARGVHSAQGMPIAQTNATFVSYPAAPPAYGEDKVSNIPPPPKYNDHAGVQYHGFS